MRGNITHSNPDEKQRFVRTCEVGARITRSDGARGSSQLPQTRRAAASPVYCRTPAIAWVGLWGIAGLSFSSIRAVFEICQNSGATDRILADNADFGRGFGGPHRAAKLNCSPNASDSSP
jgi:hypothetical protein